MLALGVYPNERIFIGDDIFIAVKKKTNSTQFVVVIEAPKDVKIIREKILNEKNNQKLPNSAIDK